MIELSHLAALLGVLGAGIVYGTDAFSALVLRPALARVDDATLVAAAGNIHRYGDRRMPVPGVLGLLGSAGAAVLAGVAGEPLVAAAAGTALALLLVWLVLYVRISAPINRVLTQAADHPSAEVDARALQRAWDRIIVLRAVLQGLAVLALALSLLG